MKKIITSLFLSFLLLVSFTRFSIGNEVVNYVGVKEEEEFIWKYTIDDDGYEDFLDVLNIEPEDDYEGKKIEDYEGKKIFINEIDDDESKVNYDYLHEDTKYNGIMLDILTYYTEDFEEKDWVIDDGADDLFVFKFDKELYALLILTGFLSFMPPILATDVDWEEVKDELKDSEDNYKDIEDMDVEVMGRILEVSIEWSEDYYEKDVEEKIILKYTEAGVLEYFELTYDGEQIVLIELQKVISGYHPYVLIGISVVTILVLILNYKKKKIKNLIKNEK